MSRLTRDYFIGLQKALHKKAIGEPVLVIDMPRLNHNIDKLRADLPCRYELSDCRQIFTGAEFAEPYCQARWHTRSVYEF
jgi:hypothetical protein